LHPGWNTFSTPLGGSGYAVTVTYDGGSATASSTGDICP
jgi:anti-sigma-K factor RskA